MTRTLTVDEFMRLPQADRDAVMDWLRSHVGDPEATYLIEVGDPFTTIHMYERFEGRIRTGYQGRPATYTISVRPIRPFPLELEDQ